MFSNINPTVGKFYNQTLKTTNNNMQDLILGYLQSGKRYDNMIKGVKDDKGITNFSFFGCVEINEPVIFTYAGIFIVINGHKPSPEELKSFLINECMLSNSNDIFNFMDRYILQFETGGKVYDKYSKQDYDIDKIISTAMEIYKARNAKFEQFNNLPPEIQTKIIYQKGSFSGNSVLSKGIKLLISKITIKITPEQVLSNPQVFEQLFKNLNMPHCQIKKLDLSGIKLSPENCKDLFEALAKNNLVIELNLSNCQLDSEMLENISQAERIAHLNVSNNNLKSLKHILLMPSLTHLNASSNEIKRSFGLEMMADRHAHPNLLYLNIGNNRAVFAVLPFDCGENLFPKLTHLIINNINFGREYDNMNITATIREQLKEIATCFPDLKYLNVKELTVFKKSFLLDFDYDIRENIAYPVEKIFPSTIKFKVVM